MREKDPTQKDSRPKVKAGTSTTSSPYSNMERQQYGAQLSYGAQASRLHASKSKRLAGVGERRLQPASGSVGFSPRLTETLITKTNLDTNFAFMKRELKLTYP